MANLPSILKGKSLAIVSLMAHSLYTSPSSRGQLLKTSLRICFGMIKDKYDLARLRPSQTVRLLMSENPKAVRNKEIFM